MNGSPEQHADAAPQMLELLRQTLDAFRLDPSDRGQGYVIDAIEDFLWRLDGNE